MKIITLGTGPSCIHHADKIRNLTPDIKKLAFHRAFIYLKERGIDIDYWTWTDPHAAESGLTWMIENPDAKHPKIILPYWSRSLNDFLRFYNLNHAMRGVRIENHFRMLNSESVKKNVIFLDNAINSVHQSDILSNDRFTGKYVAFHTQEGKGEYKAENVFTRNLLPICHYLGATEVYNLGLDNQGKGIDKVVSQWKDQEFQIHQALEYFAQWRKWDDKHGMKIYRCMEDRFTNIGDILPYKPLEDLYE